MVGLMLSKLTSLPKPVATIIMIPTTIAADDDGDEQAGEEAAGQPGVLWISPLASADVVAPIVSTRRASA